jgi:polyisoprenoid-binding protein YceI
VIRPLLAASALSLALAMAATPARAADFEGAPGSTLAFGGTFQGEPFAGTFPEFRTTLSFDPDDLAAARLDVAIDLASATTANADYDTELRGTSFLDSARFPTAHYRATRFRHLGGDRYAADGPLSLHGVERPDTL